METTLRNEDLGKLAEVLKNQAASRFDVVAHSDNLEMRGGNLVVKTTTEAEISELGVTPPRDKEVTLSPTNIFDSGISTRLKVPAEYLGRVRSTEGMLPLYDHNINAWLKKSDRQWFVRGYADENGGTGVARAFLSDRFGCIDNYDVLIAALEGVRSAGVEAEVIGCDLTERRMQVRVAVPNIAVLAPDLLKGYRSPFLNDTNRGGSYGWTLDAARKAAQAEGKGYSPGEEPVIFAGFVIANSETGSGRFTITPRMIVQPCKNGLTISQDALARTHLGSQMDAGIIEWSAETTKKQVELVTSQAADAVRTFCDVEYIRTKIAEIEAEANSEVQKPTEVITEVCKTLKFTEAEADGVLGHFIKGGQTTAGGVMNAVTSYAQTILDPDRASEIEESGLQALVQTSQLVSA